MMDLFRELLLIILLLRLSEGNDEWETTPVSDSFVHYGEFCLRLPDSPHTSSETVIQPSKSSPQPPKHVTQPPAQPATEQITKDPADSRKPISLIDGCRCKEEKDVLTDENLRLRQIKITSPHDSCHSVVLILTLMNDTEVCSQQTSAVSLLALYDKLKQSATPLVPEPQHIPSFIDADDFLPPVNPIEELPLDPSFPTVGLNPDEEIERMHSSLFLMPPTCETCDITSNLDNVDPTAIQSLDVTIAPFHCPLHINITMKDGQVFCLNSGQPEFEAALMRLEMPPSPDDHTDLTPKNSTEECRCEGREQKTSHRHLLRNTKIWPPSEACSSMEFIETLVNGSEVCVTAANISAYVKQAISNKPDPEPDLERERMDQPEILYSLKSIEENQLYEGEWVMYDVALKKEIHYEPDFRMAAESGVFEELRPCRMCYTPEEWNSVDPQDVESVELTLHESHCPVILHVTRKNKDGFCIDSSHSMFLSLLEKLDSPRV